MIAALLAAALVSAPAAGPITSLPEGNWVDLPEDTQLALLRELSQRPLADRLLEVSRRFLGTPYVVSPLGEGFGVDPDPPFRWDAVDCLTFVEQTIALSLSRRFDQVDRILLGLRYDKERSYDDRNHLMEAQWLPYNQRKGFLEDVTERYGGENTRVEFKTLTRESWRSPSSQALQLDREHQVEGIFPLRIIPLDQVLQRAPLIPSGTIMVVVREDRPQRITRITHLGFLVHQRGRAYLRHATRDAGGRVRDELLETFLLRNGRYGRWPVVGVSLFQVREQPKPVMNVRAP